MCWGISSVRITLSSRRVIDTSAASGGPEGKQPPPPTLSLHPSIHPSLLPAPYPSVRPLHCFLSSAGSSAACPGADSDGERPPTSHTPGRKRMRRRRRRRKGPGTVRDCRSKPRLRVQFPPFTNQNLSQDRVFFFCFIYLFIYFFSITTPQDD